MCCVLPLTWTHVLNVATYMDAWAACCHAHGRMCCALLLTSTHVQLERPQRPHHRRRALRELP